MSEHRDTARLEAFCDGVFAIALTLLIIDIKLPDTGPIVSTPDLWRALQHLLPAVSAFVLSFCIILITWVNHHAMLKLVHHTSTSFIYANGFLLLTVVFIPFPTSLLGEFILTDHAAPAVVLYNAVLAVQALAWITLAGSALKHGLTQDDHAAAKVRDGRKSGYFAMALYALFAVAALFFPLAVAIATMATWAFWLAFSARLKRE